MLRQRTLSVAVFVPPLLIVVALGEPWFGALIAAFVAIGAWEAMRLLRQAGYAVVPVVGIAGALAVAANIAGLPGWGNYEALLVAGVVAIAGIAAFRERDTTVGLAVWMATAFGALYVGQSAATQFDIRSSSNDALGQVISSSVYLGEDGKPGALQQVDLAA